MKLSTVLCARLMLLVQLQCTYICIMVRVYVVNVPFSCISDTMAHVTIQLRLLWRRQMVDLLFARLPNLTDDDLLAQSMQTTQQNRATERGVLRNDLILIYPRFIRSMLCNLNLFHVMLLYLIICYAVSLLVSS